MCLRFAFLLIARMASWLRPSRREEARKAAEILILRHQLAVLQRRQPRRPTLNWTDRALIAALLGVIPKARCHGLRLLVTPDTIVRWHRDIVRRRWAVRSTHRRTGRPATRRNITALVLWLARENPEWGYRRIPGELAGLGVRVSPSTVWEILKKAGIDPAPRRTGAAWPQFLRSQAEAILACGFFTADLLDGTQAYVLAVISVGLLRGSCAHPRGIARYRPCSRACHLPQRTVPRSELRHVGCCLGLASARPLCGSRLRPLPLPAKASQRASKTRGPAGQSRAVGRRRQLNCRGSPIDLWRRCGRGNRGCRLG
jgi:transposase